tara:strand:- start:147 stop:371 length:225 start_codon:yes stop_codon:yes gene_type:complete
MDFCEDFINPYYDLISELPLPKSTFYTGNWMLHEFERDMFFSIYKRLVLYKKRIFFRVGCYREDLKGYGFDYSD